MCPAPYRSIAYNDHDRAWWPVAAENWGGREMNDTHSRARIAALALLVAVSIVGCAARSGVPTIQAASTIRDVDAA
jgi:hypothetical protein